MGLDRDAQDILHRDRKRIGAAGSRPIHSIPNPTAHTGWNDSVQYIEINWKNKKGHSMSRIRSASVICILLAWFAPGTVAGADDVVVERPAYKIGVEDVLDINVWKNADVSGQVWVRPDGRITVPLAGEVFVEGLTLQELAETVTERMKEYFTQPVVTITLVETNSYTIYLLGRINTPGVMKLRSPRTFLQVLAMAGGFQEFADSDKVVVVRWEGQERTKIRVDVDKIIKKDIGADFLMVPGDVIIVP